MPNDLLLRAWTRAGSTRVAMFHRLRSDQRGEGVISAAIAVLVMAFLGVAMWLAFNTIFDNTQKKANDQVTTIGN